MRTITDHKVNGLNEALEITALDAAGPGGANHRYQLYIPAAEVAPWLQVAKKAYNAYCAARNWKSVRGEPLPQFDAQAEDIVAGWVCAAQAAAISYEEVCNRTLLKFQNGPIQSPSDFNGITNEALLTVIIDRMRGFQYGRKPSPVAGEHDDGFDFNSRGKFACRENACALTHLEEALMWLQKRTRDRMARGVEGENEV